jgi:uncharacterized protein YgbK (DUF1537 family)
VLGCIADDLTGATDLAALVARTGVAVSLRLGVPLAHEEATSAVEVVALKIRSAPVAAATEQAIAASRWLMRRRAATLYWKYCSTFDSTAEGNIGPVALALMAEANSSSLVYCPAYPENGRTVYMGNLFVHEQRLDYSPMRDHPLTPMRDADLGRLLGPQVHDRVGLISWPIVRRGSAAIREAAAVLIGAGVHHLTADALTDADLFAIADAFGSDHVLSGGSVLAMQLARVLRDRGLLPAKPASASWTAPSGRTLVLSGSCSAMSNVQVRSFVSGVPSYRLDPMTLARDGQALATAKEWLSNLSSEVAMVYATAEPDDVAAAQSALGPERAGMAVEHALGELAKAAIPLGFCRIVVAGGETSGAVAAALGVRSLQIGPEVAPGVPWTLADGAGQRLALLLKSGNFGGPQFFAEAQGALA